MHRHVLFFIVFFKRNFELLNKINCPKANKVTVSLSYQWINELTIPKMKMRINFQTFLVSSPPGGITNHWGSLPPRGVEVTSPSRSVLRCLCLDPTLEYTLPHGHIQVMTRMMEANLEWHVEFKIYTKLSLYSWNYDGKNSPFKDFFEGLWH